MLRTALRDRARAERGRSVGVQPLQIEPHVQRAIGDVGQRGVLIADEAVKRAAAEPQKLEARECRRRFRPGPVAIQFEPRGGAIRAAGSEGDVAFGQSRVRNLDGRHLHALDLRISVEKFRRQESGSSLRDREPSKFRVSRWMKFFIESVAIRPVLSPVV